MRAPRVLRFQTYGVTLTGTAKDYADAVLALPALGMVSDAAVETRRIEMRERDE